MGNTGININTNTEGAVYCIDRLTHRQAAERIAARPAVIVPLGGCEPFGGVGAVGAETACADAVAREVSRRCGALAAPAVPFGCSAPFMAFAGAAGVKPRTFVNMMCEILQGYVFQGVKRIFLVNAAPFNGEPGTEVICRVEGKYPGVRVVMFDINGDCGFDRDDAVLLSILAYVRPDMVYGSNSPDARVRDGWADRYKAWRKRGRDPQKLRSLCPDGLFLPPNENITPERGKDNFERVVGALLKEIEPML